MIIEEETQNKANQEWLDKIFHNEKAVRVANL